MKKPIGLFTIILLLISLMPSRIFADGSYIELDQNEWLTFGYNGQGGAEKNVCFNVDGVRVFITNSGDGKLYILGVYTSSFKYKTNNGTSWYDATGYTYNNVRYYYFRDAYGYLLYDQINFTVSSVPNWSSKTTNEKIESGIYYTFGDGAIEPEDPTVFGDLKNLGFYTKFVNSRQSNISQMALNKDVITWDPFQDTNGNDLNNADYRVDIQAATVDYEASTKSDLLNQVLNDMTTGSWSELVSITPNVGQYEITWDQVAQQLWHTDNITVEFWNNLFNVYDSARGVFFKNGWIYRIRLRTSDNSYVGQWQTVYNITSMPPSDSDKVYTNYYVYNYTVPNEDTYQIIQNINNINNTENNWYQNDQPFNPETAGDNWLSKLIEAILSFLGQLIHDILGLFTFESFDIPDFESNKINIINNTGLFGETLQFTDQLKQAMENVEYVEPVLTYPGLTIDNVQLIQPMTFNLNDYVQNEEIQDIRSLAYLVTDGFIYLCLVLLIKNKIMGVLKK